MVPDLPPRDTADVDELDVVRFEWRRKPLLPSESLPLLSLIF
jgi:hypothetical protein